MQSWSYQYFLSHLKKVWRQGQHLDLVGPTGSGKTIAARDIVALREYLVVIATKSSDESLNTYNTKRISSWPPSWEQTRVMFWIKPKKLGSFVEQQVGVYKVMSDVFRVGGWTLYVDDMFYVSNTLGLKRAVQMMYTQARSQYITLVASLQRPRGVPVEVINQATYLLLFRIRDKLDVDRVAQEMSVNRAALQQAVDNLNDYEFLFLETGKEPVHVERATL